MAGTVKHLLSVDWDAFFWSGIEARGLAPITPTEPHPAWQLYDWGHKEAPLYIEPPLWHARAMTFGAAGEALPGTTGEEQTFWGRFQIAPETPLYVAESHSSIMHLRAEGWTDVWNYDAHHDGGYGAGMGKQAQAAMAIARVIDRSRWSCEDWAVAYALMGVRVHVRYPRWCEPRRESTPWLPMDRAVDNRKNGPGKVDGVFLCRSGAWVPAWLDDAFADFVRACPAARVSVLDMDWWDPLVPRGAVDEYEQSRLMGLRGLSSEQAADEWQRMTGVMLAAEQRRSTT